MKQHTTPRTPAAPARQKGAALIVTVLLMMVISLLALTAMTRNNLDERMAFNQRDRQVALQAAEAALREAEAAVSANFGKVLDESFFFGKDACADASGWCYPKAEQHNWTSLNAAAWTAGKSTIALNAANSMTGVSAQPRYVVEFHGAEHAEPGMPCVGRFLITARAQGRNANSTVMLQSHYRLRVGNCMDAI